MTKPITSGEVSQALDDEYNQYLTDPKPLFTHTYKCDRCGARYEAQFRVSHLSRCRNVGCSGKPRHT